MLNTVAAHALLAGVPVTKLLLLSFIEWIHRLPFFVFVVLWLDCQRLVELNHLAAARGGHLEAFTRLAYRP
jgi:hypothetical protein